MPIRINLLAEAQAAEEMRRKDPVKRAVWIAGFVVFLALLYSATLQFKIIVAKSESSGLQANWKGIEAQVKEVTDHRARTRDLESKLAALDQFTTNRMLWAPAFNALQHTAVEGVQLVRIHTEQTFVHQEGTRPSLENSPAATGAKPPLARPSTATEKIIVTLDGRDYSASPGSQVPRFKQALASSAYFDAVLQKTNTIQLTSQTAPYTEFGRSFVGFGFKMIFEEKERRLHD
jgi:hypothetical protein